MMRIEEFLGTWGGQNFGAPIENQRKYAFLFQKYLNCGPISLEDLSSFLIFWRGLHQFLQCFSIYFMTMMNTL